MKLTINLVLGIAALLLAATGCLRKRPQERDLVLAVAGQNEIRESDFRAELDLLDPSLSSKYRKNRMALLNKMIEEEVIYQKAVERNIARTPEAKKRLARVEQHAAIERLKQLEIYSGLTVTREEIEERYRKEVARPDGSDVVKSILYVCNLADSDVSNVVRVIEKGVQEGVSFAEIARRNSLACQGFEFDSAAFYDLPQEIRSVAVRMNNRTGISRRGTPLYLFKDAELLFRRVIRDRKSERAIRTECFHRIRQAIRGEKKELALREWLSSRRASSTIRIYEKALEDMTKTDTVAAEVNGAPVTVGDVAALLESLPFEERNRRIADKKALLHEAIDRELLGQEALRRNLLDHKVVKRKVARETRRLLVEIITEQNVAGVTPAAREEFRAEWVAELKRAAGVKIFAENVKKMYIPASKEIRDIFGGEPI